jgi:carboxyl-terminal processing protease
MTRYVKLFSGGLAALLLFSAPALLSGCAGQEGDVNLHGQPVSELPAPTTLSDDDKKELLAAVERQVKDRAYVAGVDFSKWPDHVKKHQKEFDNADTVAQFTRAVNRALNEFGVSHIDIMSPKMVQTQHETSFGGIGVGIKLGDKDEGILIETVRAGGPADKAGIKEGDVIVAVNGKSPVVQGMIKGPVGTDVTLTVKHPKGAGDNAEKTEDLKLTRAKVEIVEAPHLTKVGDDAAVLRLDSFTEMYDRATIEKLFKQAKDLPMLVIDLRSNGGGSVTNLYHFLSLLLPRGTEVGTFINRKMAQDFADATKENDKDATKVAEWAERKVKIRSNPLPYFAGKVAVLINPGTASASEITAAALRELREAPLIGVHSAGAVLMSQYVPLKSGFQMKVPTSDYVTIKGLRIEHNPLKPDLDVSAARSYSPMKDESKDETVLKAVEYLRTHAPAAAKEEEKKN